MTHLDKWLKYLEGWHYKSIDLGLERVQKIANVLGLSTFTIPVITIAGTNGKGSTLTSIASCYKQAGYVTGLYTSPHLLRFNERIQINQQACDDGTILQAFEKIHDCCEENMTRLSYFEFTTLAALWIFKQQTLDILLLEVGLGGRLDAVNCVKQDLSIITTIDYDHQGFLGHTRDLIAIEKVGIVSDNQTVIIMETDIPSSMERILKEKNTVVFSYQKNYSVKKKGSSWDFCINGQKIIYSDLPYPSSIPLSNVATAIAAIMHFQNKLPITIEAIRSGLNNIQCFGRCQILQKKPLICVDVAHNQQSVARFREFITPLLNVHGNIHILFSALADKSLFALIEPFSHLSATWHIAAIQHERAANLAELAKTLKEKNCIYNTYPDLKTAYKYIGTQLDENDSLFVYGSFFTISAVCSD